MATETPILDAILNADPSWGLVTVVLVLGLALLIAWNWKPQWQREQEAQARLDQIMARKRIAETNFPPPKPAGLVEFLIRWRYLLQLNNKQADFVIAIPNGAWMEFNEALRDVLPETFRQMVEEGALKQECKIVGFKFVPTFRYYPLPESESPQILGIIKQAHERMQTSWIPKNPPSVSPKPKPRSPQKPRPKSRKKASKRR